MTKGSTAPSSSVSPQQADFLTTIAANGSASPAIRHLCCLVAAAIGQPDDLEDDTREAIGMAIYWIEQLNDIRDADPTA